MKSSWLRAAALASCVLLVANTRGHLAATAYQASRRDYQVRTLLPSGPALEAMSLGHRAALADFLWGGLMVDFGDAAAHKLPYDARPRIEAIQTLDPSFAPLYEFMDTFLVLGRSSLDHPIYVDDARAFFERGITLRPRDAKIWLAYGRFLAYGAPGAFKDDVPKVQAWKIEGARAIQHAVELGSDSRHSLGAAGILRRFGQEDANVHALERQLAVVDDADLRASIEVSLEKARAAANFASADADAADYIPELHDKLRTIGWVKSVDRAMAWGPFVDAAACAGDKGLKAVDCATTWADRLQRWRAY